MKPPISQEAVFKGKNGKKERVQRIKNAATFTLNAVTAPQHYKDQVNAESRGRITSAERALVKQSDAFRKHYAAGLSEGMIFQAPTKEGGHITATAITGNSGIKEKASWRIKVASAKGMVSEFTADVSTQYRGSSWGHERSWVDVSVVNPENGKSYEAYKYGDLGEAQATSTVAAALGKLEEAREAGTLAAITMPAGALSQQAPNLV